MHKQNVLQLNVYSLHDFHLQGHAGLTVPAAAINHRLQLLHVCCYDQVKWARQVLLAAVSIVPRMRSLYFRLVLHLNLLLIDVRAAFVHNSKTRRLGCTKLDGSGAAVNIPQHIR